MKNVCALVVAIPVYVNTSSPEIRGTCSEERTYKSSLKAKVILPEPELVS